MLEVFDGTAGCGALVSIGCNDDSCGTRSVVTVNVTTGQLLYIRVGGFSQNTGSFLLNAAGDLGTVSGFADANNYGAGCYNGRASFYEFIPDPANFDLSNSAFTMLPTSGGYTVILAGDVPLLKPGTLARLVDDTVAAGTAASVLTCVVEDAGAYGRILKDAGGRVTGIVEARDATPGELAIGEYNTGVFCFRTDQMIEALGSLTTDNKQGEYYLTDTVAYLVGQGRAVGAVVTTDPGEVVGINTVAELGEAEAILARRGD